MFPNRALKRPATIILSLRDEDRVSENPQRRWGWFAFITHGPTPIGLGYRISPRWGSIPSILSRFVNCTPFEGYFSIAALELRPENSPLLILRIP